MLAHSCRVHFWSHGENLLLKKTSALAAVFLALAGLSFAQQDLKAAMAAAMGEAIEDERYPSVITKYGLPAPDLLDSTQSNFTAEYGETFTHIDRTPGSKVLEFAQDQTEAHFVLGTNERMASMRF